MIDLSRLLDKAFFTEEHVVNATEAITRANDRYLELANGGGASFDIVAPLEPDENWARERVLHPLVYYCESKGATLPRRAGLFVSLFAGDKLYCLVPQDVIAW